MKGASKMKNATAENNFKVIESKVVANYTDAKALPTMKTIKEMVEITGLSYTFLRNLCMENKIIYIRTGKKYLINYDRFVDYLNGISRS